MSNSDNSNSQMSIQQQLAERRARLMNQNNNNNTNSFIPSINSNPTITNVPTNDNHIDDLEYARQLQQQFDAETVSNNNNNNNNIPMEIKDENDIEMTDNTNTNNDDRIIDGDHEIALQLQRQYDQETSNVPPPNHNPNPNPNPNFNNLMSSSFSTNNNGESTGFSSSTITINDNGNIRTIHTTNNPMNNNGNGLDINAFLPAFQQPFFRQNMDNGPPMMHINMLNNFMMGGLDGNGMNGLFTFIPQRPPVANQETVNALPTDTYKPKEQAEMKEESDNKNEKEKETCSICLEEFKPGDEIRRLPCLHIFHKNEIDRWLLNGANKCPICRVPIDGTNNIQQ